MVSPVLTENYYTGGFLISEADGKLSRDLGIIENAGAVDLQQEAGLVLAQNLTGTPTIAAVGALHGNGVVSGVTLGNNALTGAYTLTATSPTQFALNDPNGDAMAPVNVGTVYADAELGLTITAGSTAYAAGDAYTVTVPAGDKSYSAFTGAPGRPAAAVLFNLEWIPAGGSKKVTVITRNAEVNKAELQWDPSIVNGGSAAALETAGLASLATHNIIAR
jgi:hypothetical protein